MFGENNGYATVIGTGGTLPYIYVWDSLVTNQINDTAINLFSGNYNVQIIDNNGCTLDTTITISEPAELILSDIYTNVSCFGGNNGLAVVEVSGGIPPYIYLWIQQLEIKFLILHLIFLQVYIRYQFMIQMDVYRFFSINIPA